MNVSLFVPYAFLYHSSDCDETSVSCCAHAREGFCIFFDGVLWGVLWGLPHLLLNHWTDFNQTWHKYFTQWENQHRTGVFFDTILLSLIHI